MASKDDVERMFEATTYIGKRSRKKSNMARQDPPWISPSTAEVDDNVKSYQRLEKAGLKGNIGIYHTRHNSRC
ncbi:unnamed protein product [Dracunculus medinensis]|uniref:Protein polybromo-1 n=1 Tax=Dracunculus medinensis TaxID=318479 RepID=A0A0N4UGA7_DRAME|nr:unnamed protein product [Dracunculus medinensis]